MKEHNNMNTFRLFAEQAGYTRKALSKAINKLSTNSHVMLYSFAAYSLLHSLESQASVWDTIKNAINGNSFSSEGDDASNGYAKDDKARLGNKKEVKINVQKNDSSPKHEIEIKEEPKYGKVNIEKDGSVKYYDYDSSLNTENLKQDTFKYELTSADGEKHTAEVTVDLPSSAPKPAGAAATSYTSAEKSVAPVVTEAGEGAGAGWLLALAGIAGIAGIAAAAGGSGGGGNAAGEEVLPSDPDSDGDGIVDSAELDAGLDPNDADTDDDGLGDGEEVNDTLTDPLSVDTDGDGIQDGTELGRVAGQGDDTDPATFIPDADPLTMTDPLNNDTDGDGINDGAEDVNKNGQFEPGPNSAEDPFDLEETDPNNVQATPAPDEYTVVKGKVFVTELGVNDVLLNDVDPESDQLSFRLIDPPTNAKIDENGNLVFDAKDLDKGDMVIFNYEVTDGKNPPVQSSITFNVVKSDGGSDGMSDGHSDASTDGASDYDSDMGMDDYTKIFTDVANDGHHTFNNFDNVAEGGHDVVNLTELFDNLGIDYDDRDDHIELTQVDDNTISLHIIQDIHTMTQYDSFSITFHEPVNTDISYFTIGSNPDNDIFI